MPTYIILNRWTQQGVEKVKESPTRLDAVKRHVREMGGELRGFYLTMGQYDFVAIVEAPDEETAARILLSIGARGSSRSETLRAFPEDEYRKIIAALP